MMARLDFKESLNMYRIVQRLTTDWLYRPQDDASASAPNCAEDRFTVISLPHTNIELPYHNFSEKEHCFVSWYRRHFKVAESEKGRRVFVDFGAVMIAATVYVNGKQAGPEHKGGYTPFSFDITDLVNIGGDNVLSVRVDSTERSDIPPFGYVVDYMTFGGIYRDVELRFVDAYHIANVFARPGDVLDERKKLDVTVYVDNIGTLDKTVDVKATLKDAKGKTVRAANTTVTLVPNKPSQCRLIMESLAGIELWDLDNPVLYTVHVQIEDDDAVSTRVGFRTAEFRDQTGFHLNDKPVKLRGLNRHQTYAYIGQAGPARLQRKDAEILKFDLACNIVRTSHYPQSPYFLDRCDEIGLLVLEEIPGWQHIGDDAWKQLSIGYVRAMIERDWNHPSIILWGVRINESRDDHDFYTTTNDLARSLDPTRPTGGIRCFFGSKQLEDVYTNNDFGYTHDTEKMKPLSKYLNTEFNGHMFPTKTFDQEERVKEHVLRYASVYNQIYGNHSAGGIGWCAFDYNTHAVFGSGDRICYHGVLDIFRHPKFAASFYAAHHDPAKKVVLDIASYWKLGDKSGGGGDPLIVLSNCDEIEVFVGESSRGKFGPAKDKYPNLPRPPFIVDQLGSTWGGDWKPLRVVGFIDGQQVIEKQIDNDGLPARLEAGVDDETIFADGADMTRLWFRITDRFGNVLPFAMQPVSLKLRGNGTLVGENPHSLPGGRGAVYVRAGRKPGKLTINLTTPRLEEQKVTVRLKRAE